jgi:ribosomal protein S27AE
VNCERIGCWPTLTFHQWVCFSRETPTPKLRPIRCRHRASNVVTSVTKNTSEGTHRVEKCIYHLICKAASYLAIPGSAQKWKSFSFSPSSPSSSSLQKLCVSQAISNSYVTQEAKSNTDNREKKMLFCPHCGNTVLIENEGGMRYYCQTCPYVQPILQRVRNHIRHELTP